VARLHLEFKIIQRRIFFQKHILKPLAKPVAVPP